MSTHDEDDRREYYRIDDAIALEFSPLSGTETQVSDALHHVLPPLNLLSDLHLMDLASKHMPRPIIEPGASPANYLEAVNKLIDLLDQTVPPNLARRRRFRLREGSVNSSHGQVLKPANHLVITTVLMPWSTGSAAFPDSARQATPGWRVRNRYRARSDHRRTASIASPAYPAEAGPGRSPGP